MGKKKHGRVTIRKEGSHYVVSIGGRGMKLAFSKKEAKKRANEYRKQFGRKKRK